MRSACSGPATLCGLDTSQKPVAKPRVRASRMQQGFRHGLIEVGTSQGRPFVMHFTPRSPRSGLTARASRRLGFPGFFAVAVLSLLAACGGEGGAGPPASGSAGLDSPTSRSPRSGSPSGASALWMEKIGRSSAT